MPGIHGRNAEFRLSVGEAAQTDEALSRISSTRMWQATLGKRDWKYGRGLTTITVSLGATTVEIDPDSPYVNYAAGAVCLPPDLTPAMISGITADFISMDLAGVSAKPSCTRKFSLAIDTPIVDATCIGDQFHSKVMGIPDWKGTLNGLLVDSTKWDLAIAGASGIIPRKILRFRPDPLDETTYYQGVVIFPHHEFSAGFDALEEEMMNFEGDGPLNAVIAGLPSFPNVPTS